MQTVTKALKDALNLIEAREVLRVDEHGKQIVWGRYTFYIAVNDPENATYLTLWSNEVPHSIGNICVGPGKEPETAGYAVVLNVSVLPRYRNLGLGKELYQQAARFISSKYKGLASEDSQRENQKQVPAIWKRLSAKPGGGNFLLPSVTESLQVGKRVPADFVFHNISSSDLEILKAEGMSAGSFSSKPGFDFGRDSWVAVRLSDLRNPRPHAYGRTTAYEPQWERGSKHSEFPEDAVPVPANKIAVVDKGGRFQKWLSESALTEGLSITLELLNLKIRRGEAEPLREAGKTSDSTMASALISGETVVFVFNLDIKGHIQVTVSANREGLRGKKLGVFAAVEQALQAATRCVKDLESVLKSR